MDIKFGTAGVLRISRPFDGIYGIHFKTSLVSSGHRGYRMFITLNVSEVARLYTYLRHFRLAEPVLLEAGGKQLTVKINSRQPRFITVKARKTGQEHFGYAYLDTRSYDFLVLVSYIRNFLSKEETIPFYLDRHTVINYYRGRGLATVELLDRGTVHHLTGHDIAYLIEMARMIENGVFNNHCFTADCSISFDGNGKKLVIEDRTYPFNLMPQIASILDI